MLSKQTSNLHPGQHRRQNSTPAFVANPKVHNHPATTTNVIHRRGLSLDQPTNAQSPHFPSTQDEERVSITPGFETYQQHLLREVQQQQQQTRPGQHTPTQIGSQDGTLRHLQSKSYLEYDFQLFADDHFINHTISNNNIKGLSQTPNNENNKISTQHLPDTPNFAGYFESFEFGDRERAVNNELERKLSTYNKTNNDCAIVSSTNKNGPQRPSTPQNQMNSCYFPITPMATPFSKGKRTQGAAKSQTAESSPIMNDPNMTIKAPHAMKRGSSCQDIFNTNAIFPDFPDFNQILSPPNSGKLLPVSSIDMPEFPPLDLPVPPMAKLDFSSDGHVYEPSHCSPKSKNLSSAMSSFQSSPEMAHLSLLEPTSENFSRVSMLRQSPNLLASETPVDLENNLMLIHSDSQSRSQSISDFDLDPVVEDTGITAEEIAIFIRGPDPIDGKWTCMFQDCDRSFGRKENIKSHVQTHLGDRQYRCMHCGNTFVRQHDLKRHAKIHSGVKPYPCSCGRSFARHDALTRHRQRNTCVGGFEGMSKKPTKRGRPKKARPDTEQRIQKATKTRQRVLEKAYPSSLSGSSECSFSSPPQMFDDVGVCGVNLFDKDEPAIANLAEFPSFTPPSSPGYSTGNCFSSHNSQHSRTPKGVSMSPPPDIASIPEGIEEQPSSQTMSRETSSTYYSTSPELDMLSSPTFMDFDLGPVDPSRLETYSGDDVDQMILKFSKGDTFSDLEKDPMLMVGGASDPIFSGHPWSELFEDGAESFFDDLC